MKLINHLPEANFNITGHGPGFVAVNKDRYEHSIVVSPSQLQQHWVAHIDEMKAEDCQQLLAWRPQIILIGTGTKLIFPKAEVLRPLIEAQMGVEIMDTQAACRTYAILVSENRQVLAALIV